MDKKPFLVSVIGGSSPDEEAVSLAFEVGKLIASKRWILICGGLGGVMEAAAKGAKHAGGMTIGILPQKEKQYANPYIDIPIPTGIGYARNAIVAYTGDIVIALPGSYGTLSEIGFALSEGKRVIGVKTWDIPGVEQVSSIEELKDLLNNVSSQA